MSTARRLKLRSRRGCLCCKARRQKCDEVRPSCGSCVRLRLHCCWTSTNASEGNNKTQGNPVGDGNEDVRAMDKRSSYNVCGAMSLSAFQDDICVSFALENYWKGCNGPINIYDRSENAFSVLSTLPSSKQEGSLAYNAILAHCKLFVSNRYRDARIREDALLQYGRTLRGLNEAIADENKRYKLDTIAALNNTAVLATLADPTMGESFYHGTGFAAVLADMKPEDFQEPAALNLLEHFRYGQIVVAILLGRNSNLTTEPWRTVPWAKSKSRKSSFQGLIDILADFVPISLEKSAMTSQRVLKDDEDVRRYRERILDLAYKLHEWRTLWHKSISTRTFLRSYNAETDVDFDIEIGGDYWIVVTNSVMDLSQIAIFNHLVLEICQQMVNDVAILRTINLVGRYTTKLYSKVTDNKPSLMAAMTLPIDHPVVCGISASSEILACVKCAIRKGCVGGGSSYLFVPLKVAQDFMTSSDSAVYPEFSTAMAKLCQNWSNIDF